MARGTRGTYRIIDGRGGAAPGAAFRAAEQLAADNVSLDKARPAAWPSK